MHATFCLFIYLSMDISVLSDKFLREMYIYDIYFNFPESFKILQHATQSLDEDGGQFLSAPAS